MTSCRIRLIHARGDKIVNYKNSFYMSEMGYTNVFQSCFMGVLRKLLDRGIVVASVGYRLIKTAWSTVYDSVVDCKDAAQYLIKHSNKYSLDPNNYGIWGSLVGGHLALMTALGPKSDFPTTNPSLLAYTPNFWFCQCVLSCHFYD